MEQSQTKRSAVFFLAIANAVGFFAFSALWASQGRPLTFEERVKAQEAIERVYYTHRIWPKENPQPKPPFEQIVPRAVIEAKVTDYLKKCATLDKFWQRPIQPEQLQAEMDRMARQTKDPATLKELFTALGNDPVLIAECLARPVLADGLLEPLFECDVRFHHDAIDSARAVRENFLETNRVTDGEVRHLQIEISPPNEKDLSEPSQEESGHDSGVVRLTREAFSSLASEFSQNGKSTSLMEDHSCVFFLILRSSGVGTLSLDQVSFRKTPFSWWWKHQQVALNTSSDPPFIAEGFHLPWVTNESLEECSPTWQQSALSIGIDPRVEHSAIWTGAEMIIWGGRGTTNPYQDPYATGFRYRPDTDSWLPLPTGPGCPTPRRRHTAIWTGTTMILWGGANRYEGLTGLNSGAIYDPVQDSWSPSNTSGNCPSKRTGHLVIWTGNRMVVWGGAYSGGILNSGGVYNPADDSWTATTTAGACPPGGTGWTAVWTGQCMIVWGGDNGSGLGTGGRYIVSEDRWEGISTEAGCPNARTSHTAIWSGTEMVVWGGFSVSSVVNSGSRYNPVSDSWRPTSMGTASPTAREKHCAVWTGKEMIVWGGSGASWVPLSSGGRYDPVADVWVQTSEASPCPSARSKATAVWTGTEMIVWGGEASPFPLVGGRYNPNTDSWLPTSPGSGSPVGREYHTGIWTGAEMIVWGGLAMGPYTWEYLRSGGRYDPALDTWCSTSEDSECASPRWGHTAVWTGTEMIIWGGSDSSTMTKPGARYNPLTDSWSAVSTGEGQPEARCDHSVVWTGTEMIVWGGTAYSHEINTGGRYSPESDHWTPTSTAIGCPVPRRQHSAVWTCTEMIIWGGDTTNSPYYLKSGGRYNLATDEWVATSEASGCPEGRTEHRAYWTGSKMLVWGGSAGSYSCYNGGLYDPGSDSWETTAPCPGYPNVTYAPCGWTGSEMITWETHQRSALYSPGEDAWRIVEPTAYTPGYRFFFSSVWTGNSMLIWGGEPITASGGMLDFGIASPPTIDGQDRNLCPTTSVPLSTTTFYGYQWLRNGLPIGGATNRYYTATLSGTYAVKAIATNGCESTSSDFPVEISFCADTEVSPRGAIYPARIEKDASSSAGYYLYFQSVSGGRGYNVYEGTLGTWYSHGSAPGNVCNVIATDQGTGELRAEISPSAGNHYYLVTAKDRTVEGPSGFASSGAQIDPAQSTCSP